MDVELPVGGMVGARVEAFDALEVLVEILAQGRIDVAAEGDAGACCGAARTVNVNSGNAIFCGLPFMAINASFSSMTCARVRASECSSGW